jgi:multisubunit Na+/H+ antiporter MnhE subunit
VIVRPDSDPASPTISGSVLSPAIWLRAALLRGLLFYGFWWLLAGPRLLALGTVEVAGLLPELAMGLVAAALATGVSLRLLHVRRAGRWRWGGILSYLIFHFPAQSLVAGFRVARLAVAPRRRIVAIGVNHVTALPAGPPRDLFATLISIAPGTLSLGSPAPDRLAFHGLPASATLAADIHREERLLAHVLGLPSVVVKGQGPSRRKIADA